MAANATNEHLQCKQSLSNQILVIFSIVGKDENIFIEILVLDESRIKNKILYNFIFIISHEKKIQIDHADSITW